MTTPVVPRKGPGSARSLPTSVPPGVRTRAAVIRANARPGKLHLAEFSKGASVLTIGEGFKLLLSYGQPVAYTTNALTVWASQRDRLSAAQLRHVEQFAEAVNGSGITNGLGSAFFRTSFAQDLAEAVSSLPTNHVDLHHSEESDR